MTTRPDAPLARSDWDVDRGAPEHRSTAGQTARRADRLGDPRCWANARGWVRARARSTIPASGRHRSPHQPGHARWARLARVTH